MLYKHGRISGAIVVVIVW